MAKGTFAKAMPHVSIPDLYYVCHTHKSVAEHRVNTLPQLKNKMC